MKKDVWLTLICGLSTASGFLLDITGVASDQTVVFFYIVAYMSGGWPGLKATIEDLRNYQINIDFLMIAAAAGAAVINLWLEGAILLFLFSLSGTLENFALDRSRTAINSLMNLRPSQGLVRHPDGQEELIEVEALRPGQIVIVKPGEHIPIDGRIVRGQSQVNQATITGESVPVDRGPGDSVFAATLNEQGVIELEVARRAKDTTLARIIELVEQAQQSKAPTQRFLERFEPVYALSVVGAVILLVLIPWLILDQPFDPVFYRGMTVLVVASPCALIISTPASIISAIANAARNGVLFKGGTHLEQVNSIDTIAFDKTGTLTHGLPVVTDIWTLGMGNGAGHGADEAGDTGTGGGGTGAGSGEVDNSDTPAAAYGSDGSRSNGNGAGEISGKELLAMAAGCERYSEHHVAEAILRKASQEGVDPVEVENLQASPGRGISARWNGTTLAAGNEKLFDDVIDSWPERLFTMAEQLKAEGKTVIYVARDNQPMGLIALADQLRPSAVTTLKELRKTGIRRMVMLTGDNPGVARAIAEPLDLDEVHAGLLPEEKLKMISRLKKEGLTAMVGDGVNDAPAVAESDLGIAMGAVGTDVALETADVVLMGDDLTRLPYMIRLSQKAKRIVWQNIVFSLVVILVLLAGVFLVDLPLTLGVVGHEGSTLIVVMNGLRLLRTGTVDSLPA